MMTDRLPGVPPMGSEGDTIGTTEAEAQGRLVGRRYRLISPVGRGGMGVVWHAHDVLLDRDVAVKELILPPGLDEEGMRSAHRRMLREARSAARLSHPGIITVHDVVEEDGRPWIVMELVRAWSLEQAVRRNGPLPVVQAAEIAVRVLDALRHAHAAGVLHRDIKPGNVLLTSDRVVLTDFGIAAIEGDVSVTQTGLLMGSPAYIPPERLSGKPITQAADLWSFGATLYTTVEGRPPYEGPDAVAVLGAILTQEPNRPQRAGALIAVIEGLLRKDPADRMTAAQVSELLGRVLRSHGSATGDQVPAVPPVPEILTPVRPAPPQLSSAPSLTQPSGPLPSRIIETPSGPVRVPHDVPPGSQEPGHGRGYDALRSPASGLGRGSFVDLPEAPPASLRRPAHGRDEEDTLAGTRPPATGGRRGARRRAADDGPWMREGRPTPLLIAVCAVAALAAVAAVLFLLLAPGSSAPQAAPAPAPAASSPASPSAAPTRFEVPGGYRTLGAGGVTAALPESWTVREDDGVVTFQGPRNSGQSVVVSQAAVTDPVTALDGIGKDDLDEYTEVGVETVPYGAWRAADWEYTYVRSPGAVPMHGLTRYVAVDGQNAYLIAFTAQDLDWAKGAEARRVFFATFRPTA
ncbi:serine/threonine-protein kinase [Streptosporangium saharense]|uniref:non-specific serine/threonine protein kinase n=1 Tax=Streptosporangium saharense TaxID=1706840 RepID=A0A7W7QN55_9ACTN|nr:serine/threonine-protein kinase [Streptosporangium saharense]MBB4916538.1 serine/threonine protein kinase [Streptosporangium saharense]